MPSSNDAASDRVVLCQRGSELAEFEALLTELGVRVEHHAGPLPSAEALAGARLVVVSASRLAESRTPPVQRWPRTIAVVDDGSRTLAAHFARIGVALIVRRPIHPHALRLLLLHQLYRGPERRARRRVAIGHPIRTGGLFKQSATLLELSRTGARIELPQPPKVGSSIQFVLGRELTGGKPVKVKARVVRSLLATSDGRPGGEIGLAFVDPTGALGKPIQAILARYANGPPTASSGAKTAAAPKVAAAAPPTLPASHPTGGSDPQEPTPPAAVAREAEAPAEASRRLPPSFTPAPQRAETPVPARPPEVQDAGVTLAGVETEIELLDIAFDPFGKLDPLDTQAAAEDLDFDFELDDVVEEAHTPASGPASPRDRRRGSRIPYEERVVALDEQAARVVVGRDLCAGGMRIEANPDLAVGDVLEIALHAGHDSQPLMLVASVERDDGRDGLVLVFATLSPAQRARLDAIISASSAIVEAESGVEAGADRDADGGAPADLATDDTGSLVVGELVRHVVHADGRSAAAQGRAVAKGGASGFTLIELMFVVAISGLMAATAFPLFGP